MVICELGKDLIGWMDCFIDDWLVFVLSWLVL